MRGERRMGQSPTLRIVGAANAFLASLDESQRRRAVFAFDDGKQRVRWSNFPTSFVLRAGIRFADMNAAQRTAAMNPLSVTLSKPISCRVRVKMAR